ncbi:cell division protein FtsQ/DivIB [Sneathiella aquimaris]|uniref:cell division protein FtsQ/DivIB n=1 Tax=Sneathiella aquimaris TaxID=2599305 RepID=UPI00146F31C6|nr:FtsQ-type POTRA domain-containing protein [Sneathiella aquimaris]
MREIKVSAQDRPVKVPPKVRKKKTAGPKKQRKKTASSPSFFSVFHPVGRFFAGLRNLSVSLLSMSRKTPKQGRKGKRRGAPNGLRKYGVPALLILTVTLPIGGLGYYIVQNSVIDRTTAWISETTNALVTSSGLTVQEVTVAGRERTSTRDMMKALGVVRGDNILTFNPEEARRRVESLGWVEHASVMRRFPDEVFIRVTERRPFARWQSNNKTVVIDRKGAVVSTRDSKEFRYLPKVVGKDANMDAAALFDVLAGSPELFTRLQNAVRIRGRRWNLEFDNGVSVFLPEEHAAQAWQRLARMHDEEAILNKAVLSIDMRSAQKMYVRLKSDDADFRRVAANAGKET